MAGGVSEQDFYEFRMLLGEIPKATNENPRSSDSRPSVSLPITESISTEKEERKSTSSCVFTNVHHARVENQSSNRTFYNGSTFKRNCCTKASDSPYDQKRQNKGAEKSDHIMVVDQDASNLPDYQSLTSTFEQLSFKDDKGYAAAGPTVGGSVKIKTIPNYPTLSEQQNVQALELPPSLTSTNDLEKFDGEIQRSMSYPPLESLVDKSEEPQQGLHFGATPFAPEMHAYQIQQPCYLGMKSSSYFQPQAPPLNRFHRAWEKQMERESHGRIHTQDLQQLQNHGSESHPIQANANLSLDLISRKPRQQMHFEMPISHQLKQVNGGSHWTCHSNHMPMGSSGCCHSQESCGREESYQFASCQKHTFAGGLTSPPPLSTTDFRGVQVFDQGVKQIFPEKILTQSHGLNSLKAKKPNFIEEYELLNHVYSRGRVFSNGRSSRVASPDNAYLRYTSRLQVQNYNSVDEVVGRINLLAKDHHGCRFLQCKLLEGTSEDVHKIFIEIIDHIVELMTDPFGNYLVQKLLEVCNEDQRMHIIHVATRKAGELVRVSCDMHGTRAVQKIIETVKSPEQIFKVVSSLRPGIVAMIKDMNGNHVAQRCLQYLRPEYSKFLFNAAAAHCVELATDRHGCCVLQKCLQNSDGEHRQMLMSEITSNALLLSQDPFGNYVVQYIIDQGVPWATENVLNQLDGNYGYLSMQKYSSNVVEKCLKFAGENSRARIIQELIQHPHLGQILQDPYGNYVAQSALAESKGALHTAFIEAIRPHAPALQNSPYGKKILSRNSLKK